MIDVSGYARALYELAAERGAEKRVREELEVICGVLEEKYITLMDTPALGSQEKCGLLRQAFAGIDPMLENFLCILCEKRAFYRFPACAQAYNAAYDEAHNILRATAITAVPMTKAQCKALREKLSGVTGKQVELENRLDPDIIGGIRLRYAGVQLEESIQSRLDALRRSLAETIV